MADALSDETEPVADDELLWRGLRKDWIREENGVQVITSVAFKDRTPGNGNRVSVFRRRLFADAEVRQLFGPAFVAVAEIPAAVPRGLGWDVVPDTEGQHGSHALIVPPAGKGTNARDKDSGTMSKKAGLRRLDPAA
jgi:hypothetical protein